MSFLENCKPAYNNDQKSVSFSQLKKLNHHSQINSVILKFLTPLSPNIEISYQLKTNKSFNGNEIINSKGNRHVIYLTDLKENERKQFWKSLHIKSNKITPVSIRIQITPIKGSKQQLDTQYLSFVIGNPVKEIKSELKSLKEEKANSTIDAQPHDLFDKQDNKKLINEIREVFKEETNALAVTLKGQYKAQLKKIKTEYSLDTQLQKKKYQELKEQYEKLKKALESVQNTSEKQKNQITELKQAHQIDKKIVSTYEIYIKELAYNKPAYNYIFQWTDSMKFGQSHSKSFNLESFLSTFRILKKYYSQVYAYDMGAYNTIDTKKLREELHNLYKKAADINLSNYKTYSNLVNVLNFEIIGLPKTDYSHINLYMDTNSTPDPNIKNQENLNINQTVNIKVNQDETAYLNKYIKAPSQANFFALRDQTLITDSTIEDISSQWFLENDSNKKTKIKLQPHRKYSKYGGDYFHISYFNQLRIKGSTLSGCKDNLSIFFLQHKNSSTSAGNICAISVKTK